MRILQPVAASNTVNEEPGAEWLHACQRLPALTLWINLWNPRRPRRYRQSISLIRSGDRAVAAFQPTLERPGGGERDCSKRSCLHQGPVALLILVKLVVCASLAASAGQSSAHPPFGLGGGTPPHSIDGPARRQPARALLSSPLSETHLDLAQLPSASSSALGGR